MLLGARRRCLLCIWLSASLAVCWLTGPTRSRVQRRSRVEVYPNHSWHMGHLTVACWQAIPKPRVRQPGSRIIRIIHDIWVTSRFACWQVKPKP